MYTSVRTSPPGKQHKKGPAEGGPGGGGVLQGKWRVGWWKLGRATAVRGTLHRSHWSVTDGGSGRCAERLLLQARNA